MAWIAHPPSYLAHRYGMGYCIYYLTLGRNLAFFSCNLLTLLSFQIYANCFCFFQHHLLPKGGDMNSFQVVPLPFLPVLQPYSHTTEQKKKIFFIDRMLCLLPVNCSKLMSLNSCLVGQILFQRKLQLHRLWQRLSPWRCNQVKRLFLAQTSRVSSPEANFCCKSLLTNVIKAFAIRMSLTPGG